MGSWNAATRFQGGSSDKKQEILLKNDTKKKLPQFTVHIKVCNLMWSTCWQGV